jgi:hypothetical protein
VEGASFYPHLLLEQVQQADTQRVQVSEYRCMSFEKRLRVDYGSSQTMIRIPGVQKLEEKYIEVGVSAGRYRRGFVGLAWW